MLSSLVIVASLMMGETPVDFGKAELNKSLHEAGLDAKASMVDVRIVPGGVRRDAGQRASGPEPARMGRKAT